MNLKDRFAKLLSSSFLMCLVGAIYEALQGRPEMVLVAVLSYLVIDRMPQVVAVLKGLDVLAEGFGLSKVDRFLDGAVSAMESKMGNNLATGTATLTPAANVAVIQTPIADALGKF